MMLKEAFLKALSEYSTATLTAFGGNPVAIYLRSDLPQLIQSSAVIPFRFRVYGSAGSGRWAEIPWVAVLDRSITTSVEEGYYIVYLFKADMSGVYLSLNQGYVQYEKRYGVRFGREKLVQTATGFRLALRSSLSDFTISSINLNARNNLGIGYEKGHICGKYYPVDNIPEDVELIDDLRNLIGVYRELKGVVGSSVFNEIDLISSNDESFQEETDEVVPIVISEGPLPRPAPVQVGGRTQYKRNPQRAKLALQNADYKCELNQEHMTFTRRTTLRQFMETHHFVPMEFQSDIEVDLDVPENIVSLCPTCHKLLHLSKNDERLPKLERLFGLRKESLTARGIIITFEDIKKMYSIQHD